MMASSILSTYPYLAGPAKTGQAERDASPLSVEDVKVRSISIYVFQVNRRPHVTFANII